MSSRPLLNLRPPSPINYKIPTQPKKTYYFNIVSLLLHLTSISFIVYLMAKTPQHRIEQVSVRQGQMSVSSIVNDEIITFDNATNTLTIWAMSVIIKPAANQHGRRLIATPASTLSVVGTIKTSHIDTTDISVQELPAAGPAGPAGAQGPPGINGTAGTNGQDGPPGAQGPPGINGTAGINGQDGSPGAQGSPGARGPPGTNGTAGTNGRDGSPGAQGPPGTNGTAGINGQDGSPGDQGPPGAQGSPGAQGPPGINGTAGTNGTGAEYLIFRNNELQINVSKVNIAGNLHVDGDFSRDGDEI